MTLIASIIKNLEKKMLPSTLDLVPSPSTWKPRPSTLDKKIETWNPRPSTLDKKIDSFLNAHLWVEASTSAWPRVRKMRLDKNKTCIIRVTIWATSNTEQQLCWRYQVKAAFDVAAFAGESDKVACLCTILLTIRTLIGCVCLHRLDSENVNVLLEVSVSIEHS